MKILRSMIVCFCVQVCQGTNSSEFKSAVRVINNEASKNLVMSNLVKLVKKNVNIVTEKEDLKENTLLHYSKARGWPSLNDYLVRKGADLQAKNANDQTPDEFAGSFSLNKEKKARNMSEYYYASKPEKIKEQKIDKLIEESKKLDEFDLVSFLRDAAKKDVIDLTK